MRFGFGTCRLRGSPSPPRELPRTRIPQIHGRAVLLLLGMAAQAIAAQTPDAAERVRVLSPDSGVTATLVMPAARQAQPASLADTVDLVFYALPNGNSTAETMGRARVDSASWRHDIQHIAAQTRAARARGLSNLVVVYLEAAGRSWPAWRQGRGYTDANRRIRALLHALRDSVASELSARDGHPSPLRVTLSGHSGGGSLMFGLVESQDTLPAWLDRVAFLDANYNFDARHGPVLDAWLAAHASRRLYALAYDDREIRLDGRKVVSDSGGTWRATERMRNWWRRAASPRAARFDTAGAFQRWRDAAGQVELLVHPNPDNRILHTELVGEMNGFLYVVLANRVAPSAALSLPMPPRLYTPYIRD